MHEVFYQNHLFYEVYRGPRPEGPWTQIYNGSLRDLNTSSNLVEIALRQGAFFRFIASLPTDLNDEDDTYEDTLGGIPTTDDPTGTPPQDYDEDDNAYQADGVMCDIVFVTTTESTPH